MGPTCATCPQEAGTINKLEREHMKATSPIQLRQNILAAKAEIETVCRLLLANERERHLALGNECSRTAFQLQDLLDKQVVPTEYGVAVVGRFKAGCPAAL